MKGGRRAFRIRHAVEVFLIHSACGGEIIDEGPDYGINHSLAPVILYGGGPACGNSKGGGCRLGGGVPLASVYGQRGLTTAARAFLSGLRDRIGMFESSGGAVSRAMWRLDL